MKKQSIVNSFFRTIRFIVIMFLGFLVYQSLLVNILTKDIHIVSYVMVWLFTSYVILPYVNKKVTKRYLPDYFIGRSRTSDGLLGDPINLAFLGEEQAIEKLFLTSGWKKAEPLSVRTSIRIVIASVIGKSYPNAPVSTLFLFGNKQDFAFEKEIKNNPRRRHHIRIWKTPTAWYLPGGRQADWLGAATYDKKVGISYFTGQVTHKIDSDVDEEREFVLSSFEKSTLAISVERVEHFTTSYYGRNGSGDEIHTDGALPFIRIKGLK